MEDKKLSIVTPFLNEEGGIDVFFQAIYKILDTLDMDFEIICVDDGSTDNTLALLAKKNKIDPRVKIVSLSRNFGKENALTAGLALSTGDAIVPIDADLQDPPELIPQMIKLWREGNHVVLATRSKRDSDSKIKKNTANLFYKAINFMSDLPIPENTGDFRLMDRIVVDALNQLPERTRFMKGLFAWLGFEQTTIHYERPKRAEGSTKWNTWKLWNFALDGIFSFSTTPIRIWTYIGVTTAASAALYAIFIAINTLARGVSVPGYASITCLILFFSGVNLIGIGLLGEYIGRIFLETKRRPLYIAKKKIGF